MILNLQWIPAYAGMTYDNNNLIYHSVLDTESSVVKSRWIPTFVGMTYVFNCRGKMHGKH